MDDTAIRFVKQHYQRHANNGTTQEALQRRRRGPALPLKRFHNNIKDKLITRFCFGAEKVLDLCCGRGGDIRKYAIAQVGYVKGIDLSSDEIEEAKRRFREQLPDMGSELRMEFESTDVLGNGVYKDDQAPYDRVTCFFAVHYFMVTEEAVVNLFMNVANNLKLGGYFVCTCPDGKRVISALMKSTERKKLQTPMLTLIPRWKGHYACFGSAFTCSIKDTVTEGAVDADGSYEYLVFTTPLKQIAAKFGLKLILNYEDSEIDELFIEEDRQSGFKHFAPRFPQSDPSLEQASSLNMAFVFQKVAEVEDQHTLTLEEVNEFKATLPPKSDSTPSPTLLAKRKNDEPAAKEETDISKRSRVQEVCGPTDGSRSEIAESKEPSKNDSNCKSLESKEPSKRESDLNQERNADDQ